jgi:cystathionine beta-lyase/cystathionine gamma-synthase
MGTELLPYWSFIPGFSTVATRVENLGVLRRRTAGDSGPGVGKSCGIIFGSIVGANRLLTYIRVHVGVTVHHVDTTDPSAITPLLHPTKTAMVLLESPTNPLLKIADISAICADVKLRAPEAVVVVDNTMMSPYLQRPLEHGADIVYDSATKYLSGHHDLMAGVITCNREDLAKVCINLSYIFEEKSKTTPRNSDSPSTASEMH